MYSAQKNISSLGLRPCLLNVVGVADGRFLLEAKLRKIKKKIETVNRFR